MALKMKRVEITNSRSLEGHMVGRRITGGERQHGEAVAALQIVVDENRKRQEMRIGIDRRTEIRTGRDQFEEVLPELDDVVARPPGVAIARADLKAEPFVKLRLRVEIAGCKHQMVDRAWHGKSLQGRR